MAVNYTFDAHAGIIKVQPKGVLSISDISDYVASLIEDKQVTGSFVEIVDFQFIDDFQFSFKEAAILPSLFEELKNTKGYKGTILLAKSDLQFGMARMCSIILEENADVRVVRSLAEIDKHVQSLRG